MPEFWQYLFSVFAEDANVEAPETDAEDPETVSEEISADGGENATETETSQKDEEVIDDNEW